MSGLAISSVISALLLIQSASSRTYKSSDDNKLYRVIPTTEEHLNLLKTLERWFEDGVSLVHWIIDEEILISSTNYLRLPGIFYRRLRFCRRWVL